MFMRVLLRDGRIEYETCTVQIEDYGSGILVCGAFF